MQVNKTYILAFFGILFSLIAWLSVAKSNANNFTVSSAFSEILGDSTEVPKRKKTKRSTYQDKDRYGDTYSNPQSKSPLLLKDPSVIKKDVEIGDDTAGSYRVTEKIGDQDYRSPSEMTFEEFQKYKQQEASQKYWKNKKDPRIGDTTLGNSRLVPKIVMSPTLDRIFGGNVIDIKPNGNVMLDFGGSYQRVDNPATPVSLQRIGQFIFNQTIQMNVQGKIGEKLKLGINWDTKATFDFENSMKIDYNGLDYEIIKKVDAGNISFPLNSQLIQGSQNLFGAKVEMQFGKLWISAMAANQRGKSDEMVIQNNAQNKEIEIRADAYEDNRHYFLSQYFRNNYEKALANLPNVNSGITVVSVDVYVTNRNNTTDNTRNIIGLMDLGESHPYDSLNQSFQADKSKSLPDNNSNSLYATVNQNPSVRNVELSASVLEGLGIQKVAGYETVKSARKLILDKDYKVNTQLGYISLNSALRNDDVLAVAFTYRDNTTVGDNSTHIVGEIPNVNFNSDSVSSIILKLLRPTTIRTDLPMWNLQMKNIYNINQSNVSKKNFQLRIIYKDDASGVDNPSIHEGANLANTPLLQVFNLDKLNQNGDPQPDGNFDFLPRITIDSTLGRVYFPVLEPFGNYLGSKFESTEVNLKEKYTFFEIYSKTKSDLLNLASKNKFFLRVSSSSSTTGDVALPGMNISRGSVKITAGSTPLTEGTDYTVNYEQGRIKFLNDGVMASGREIRIRYEKADLFNFRQKSLIGTRFDYKFNKDIVLGGTLLHLNERPLITRVSIGDEPVSNTVVGIDLTYQKESRTITKLIDKLPLITTKAPSNVSLQGEYAAFIPGSSSLIGSSGTAYVDDFEGAENPFDLTRSPIKWKLGATPYSMSSAGENDLSYNYKRAKLAWYVVDNTFYTDANRPTNISAEDLKYHVFRAVSPQEIYPKRDPQQIQLNEPVFDLVYFPSERGAYNYNPNLKADGTLAGNAKDNFAAITRSITTDTDFDNANIQYIEFWLMDPFMKPKLGSHNGIPVKNKAGTADSLIFNTKGGKLFLNLGSVSEDVLKDGSQSFENGLPVLNTADVKNTTWAKVPTQNYVNDAFSATSGARTKQDIGWDGVNSTEENDFYKSTFIDKINPASAKDVVKQDPSADDFKHYLDPNYTSLDYKIIDRYKYYNGLENNSPENTGGAFTASSTNIPDNEDLNQNNTINDLEQYFEYEIDLAPDKLTSSSKYIVSHVEAPVNGELVNWYQFRIPIRDPSAKNVNNITDLKSIRYMRMYLTGWEEPVVLRMAQFQLVAGQWRTYSPSVDLNQKTAEVMPEPINTGFNVSTVNIEENGTGSNTTSGYVVPPGFIRDKDNTSNVSRRLNEQSLRMCVDNLGDGRARAVFKNTNFNFMNYGRLQMFIHAESQTISATIPKDSTTLRAFVRLGTDFIQNYYEIEVPLVYTVNPTSNEYEIWKQENNLDISFDALTGVKATRNRITQYDQRIAFTKSVEGRNVTIVGNPDLSSIQVMMLGIKNPITSDQNPYSACVWMDEFRVTDFVNNTGHAAVGRANVKLADFATVGMTGKYMGIGFGSIDQKISQRNLNEQIDYGVQSNVSLDKLLPSKAGLRIPVYVSYDRSTSTPKYDPTNPDVKLDASLNAIEDPTKRESMRQILIDQSTKRSINVTNLSKVKTGKNPKSHVYDIENLSVSASYSDGIRTSFLLAENSQLQYRGGLRYSFTGSPKNLEPFKTMKVQSPYLKLIKDFNLTPMPAMLSFTADVNRTYNKIQNRNSFLGTEGVDPQYQKTFTFNRTYGLNWAFTKSVSLNYSANVLAIIDEEYGEINTASNNKKVEDNLKKGGRTQRFDQTIGLNYKLPLDKFPLTDWISIDTRYAATYLWQGASLATADSLGNTIANSAEKSVNGKIDLSKLYNKVKFLKEINSPAPPKKIIPNDTTKPKPEYKLVKGIFRKLMTIKNVNFTYSLKQGTTVPGFRPKPVYAGMSNYSSADGSYAPGIPFLLGSQNATSFLEQAGRNNWISTNPNLSTQMGQNFTENLSLRTSLEPIKDFKIQLEAKRDRAGTYAETYRYDRTSSEFVHYSPTRTGTYTVTFINFKTAFIGDNSDNSSDVFKTFVANREIIKNRLIDANENYQSATYLNNSQDVLVPAFIAAYTGTDANSTSLTSFPKIPMPNWKIDYAGLTNVPFIKKMFPSVNINHSYTSVYSTGSFNNSLLYGNDFISLEHSELDIPLASKYSSISGNTGSAVFNPIYTFSAVTIKEAFSPLIGINVKTKGNITAKLEYRKTRDLSLSLSNAQVTELANNELVAGFGFTKNNWKVPFTKDFVLKNDLTFRFDLRISDTKTTQRSIQGLNTVTTGNLLVSIKPNINYIVNTRLNLQFYFDHTINAPKVSNSFYRTNTLFGIQVRFTLS